jgi:hypothetical protein
LEVARGLRLPVLAAPIASPTAATAAIITARRFMICLWKGEWTVAIVSARHERIYAIKSSRN